MFSTPLYIPTLYVKFQRNFCPKDTTQRSMEEKKTKICANLIENDKCDVLEQEMTTVYNPGFAHGSEEIFIAESENFDSADYSKSNAINFSRELANKQKGFHPILNAPNPSANKTGEICKEEENFPSELIPITFVSVSPLAVKIEIDKQRNSFVSDSQLKDPLEGYPHNFNKKSVIHVKKEREVLSGSDIKIEIKEENKDCQISSKVLANEPGEEALEINSGSEINSIAQKTNHKTNHLCVRLPTSDGDVLMTTKDIAGVQGKQNAIYDQTFFSVNSEDSFFTVSAGLDHVLEPIVNVSNSDTIVEEQLQNIWDIETNKSNPFALGGVSKNSKFGADKLSLTENQQDGKERFDEAMSKGLKLKECSVVLQRITLPYQMKADKHSANSTLSPNQYCEKELKRTKGIVRDSKSEHDHAAPRDTMHTQSSKRRVKHSTTGTHTSKKSYICEICEKSCGKKSNLQMHMRIHTGEKPFLCEICEMSFRQKNNLKIHMRTHTGEKPFLCQICDKSFSQSSQVNVHMRTHTGGKPFPCNICSKSYTQKGALQNHMHIHTGERPFKCDICLLTFKEKGTLVSHLRRHTGEKPYRCDICNVSFATNRLAYHMRTHTGEKRYECDVCKKKFYSKYDLRKHMRTHTGEKPYKCGMCDMSFTFKGNMLKHTLIHTGEKQCQCDICGISFRRNGDLALHRRIHTGDKRYKCIHCEKAFVAKGDLIKHMRIHTGEKPYICVFCSKAFSLSGDLKKHTRTHTGEKPFQCDICLKSFVTRGRLKIHMRTHNGEKCFECDICKKSFSEKNHLKLHMRFHSGERPFRCENCKMSFSRKHSLTNHLRSHRCDTI